jgi:hypothetical protein
MKIVLQDHNQCLADVAKQFEIVDIVDKADVVVLWEDVLGWPASVARLAKSRGKPLIVMQHGINAVIDYGPPKNYPLLADKLCIWSPSDARLLASYGIPRDRYVMTGTTLFSHLKPREKHEGINIVFRPAHWDTELMENYEISDILNQMKGVNIITKVMERNQSDRFKNPVFSNREEPNHLDICADVLAKADIVVSIAGDGTFELMAYAMDIPVVTCLNWREKPFLDGNAKEMFYTQANRLCVLDELEETILDTLKNPNVLQQERKLVALDYGGIGLGTNPLEEICKVIKSYEK